MRVLELAAARAPSADLAERFRELAHSTQTGELDLHRAYAREWGVGEQELEREQPAPETRAYTGFLLRTAAEAGFDEIAAALLPCMWGYSELGRSLPRNPASPYGTWIETYAAPEFAALAEWCRAVVDERAAAADAGTRARMRDAFLESSRHELRFWDVGRG